MTATGKASEESDILRKITGKHRIIVTIAHIIGSILILIIYLFLYYIEWLTRSLQD